jgi:AraC-like DNA-binding protein
MRSKSRSNWLPTATGGIARAAYARALEARLDIGPLLKSSNLTLRQVKNSSFRIPVTDQIKFLNAVADALPDPSLGIHLAEGVDLRELGLLFYVLASSETLGDALKRAARYSSMLNEGVYITYRDQKHITVKFEYVGVARLSDRHQIEFFIVTLLRICRQLTGRHLSPKSIRLAHRRAELPTGIGKVFGCDVVFGSNLDEVVYPRVADSMPIINADPFLNSLLVRYCEEALQKRRVGLGAWRLKVENTIVPLLPHGQATMGRIANQLGVSPRTLTRLLASEGHTFRGILDAMRSDLAKSYLREQELSISEVAWLLGFQRTSAFDHACKRWIGRTPKQVRSAETKSSR